MNHTERQVKLAGLAGFTIPDDEIWLSTPDGNGEGITGIHTTSTTAAQAACDPKRPRMVHKGR
jgi:hypothetical protein